MIRWTGNIVGGNISALFEDAIPALSLSDWGETTKTISQDSL